jgi:HK97 gp10 family phage protein
MRTAMFHLNSAAASQETLSKELAPVRTGFLRENIRQTKQASLDDLEAIVESAADYSVFVEYGTVNMEAQPFFTPAFESARKQLGSVRGIF